MAVILFALIFIVGIVLLIISPMRKQYGGRSARPAGAVLLVIGLIGILTQSIVSVPAGRVGLKDFFGNVSDNTLQPGIHLVNPLLTIREMDVRTQEITEVASVPSKEGLNVRLDLSILFRLDEKMTPDVYRTIGMDYARIFMIPQFRAKIRGATASYEAKALYTEQRQAITRSVHEELAPAFAERGILLEQVLMRSVTLPPQLAQAIEAKLQAEQEAERMRFVLDRERQEAERKKIEAGGINDFQRIVSQGLTEDLLRWKGIEATQNLASSANAKMVIVGGKDGLPLILNTGD